MLLPVRCFSCNYVICSKYNKYKLLQLDDIPVKEIFEQLNIKRYCCRRMFLSHNDNIMDDLLNHNKQYSYVSEI